MDGIKNWKFFLADQFQIRLAEYINLFPKYIVMIWIKKFLANHKYLFFYVFNYFNLSLVYKAEVIKKLFLEYASYY